MNHLPILPVLVPLATAIVLLLAERRGQAWQRRLSGLGLLALLASAFALVEASEHRVLVYLVGDWPARLGIALVADRLSALLVMAGGLLALPALLYASSGWDREAAHFHPLFHLQLMGINGAFLTGDLFNLFVFFEVMLIASYGLLLSGGRGARMRAGLHYVVFNITASSLFLLALGLLYGMLGSLNMAEMARRIALAPAQDLPLIRAGAGLLLVVFCAKAALLPLHLWLPQTYARAPAAAAALFVLLSKVGAYAVLRVYTLLFGTAAGTLAGWAWDWLLPAALATLALATLGALAASTLRVMASYLVVASSATLFVAFGLRNPAGVAAGLYYLLHSSAATAGLFLLADMVRRVHADARARGERVPQSRLRMHAALFLVLAIALAGLPPLSGFVGKLLVLEAVPPRLILPVWGVVLATSLLSLAALARAGTRTFWAGRFATIPGQKVAHPQHPARDEGHDPESRRRLLAVMLLAGYGLALAAGAGPVLAHLRSVAEDVRQPSLLVDAVLQAQPRLRTPSP